jgi:hypothetical protein
MNALESTPSSGETADSFQPGDHALMVLLPALLLLSVGFLSFGPGSLVENAGPAAMLTLFAVLTGERLYQRWTAVSDAPLAGQE